MPKIIFNSIWFSSDGSINRSLINNYATLKERAKDRGDEFEFVLWVDKTRLNQDDKYELEKLGIKVLDYSEDSKALDAQSKFMLNITKAAVEIGQQSNIKLYYAIASDIFRIYLLSKHYPADPTYQNDIALYIDGNDINIHNLPDPAEIKSQMKDAGLAFNIMELYLFNSYAASNDFIIADLSQKEVLANLAKLVTQYLMYLNEQYQAEGGLIGKLKAFQKELQQHPSQQAKVLFTFLVSNSINYLKVDKNNQAYGLNWQENSVEFQKVRILNANDLVLFDTVVINKFGQTSGETSQTMDKTTWLENTQANVKSPEWENLRSQRIALMASLTRVADKGLPTKEISTYLFKAKRFHKEITNGYINALTANNPEALEIYERNIERLIGILKFIDNSFEFKNDIEFQNMLIALKVLDENGLLELNTLNELFLHGDHPISFVKGILILNNDTNAKDFYLKLTSLSNNTDSDIEKVLPAILKDFDETYAESFVKLNKADLLVDAFVVFLHKVSKANQTNISDETDKMFNLMRILGEDFNRIKNYIDAFEPPDLFKKDSIGFARHFDLLQILFQIEIDAKNDDYFEIALNLANANLPYENILLNGISVLKESRFLNFNNFEILKNLLGKNFQENVNSSETQQNLLIKILEKFIQASNSRDPNTASEFKSFISKLSQDTYQHALLQIINDNGISINNLNVHKIKDQVENYVVNLSNRELDTIEFKK